MPPAAAGDSEWAEDAEPGVPRRRSSRSSTALIIGSAAVLAVLLVGAFGLVRRMLHDDGPSEVPVQSQEVSGPRLTTTAVPVAVSNDLADLPAIEQAMAACDEEAAKNRDALYFLVLPLVSPIKDYQQWMTSSVGEVGTSVILLRSKHAMAGLREGSLGLFDGQYSFSIIDSATEATNSWGPIAGVAKLARLDAARIDGFRVRFGFADFVGDTPSDFRFPREKGVCYWVSALLRN